MNVTSAELSMVPRNTVMLDARVADQTLRPAGHPGGAGRRSEGVHQRRLPGTRYWRSTRAEARRGLLSTWGESQPAAVLKYSPPNCIAVVNHYDSWAEIYDWVFARRRDDVRFYVEQARRFGGPVLELGSGTGRVAIPIAQAGIEVVGLESSTAMLREASASRPARLPEVSNG